jgi:hypothetical protein
VRDAHGVVLPSAVGGAKSASKYLSRIFAGLRAGLPDEETSVALKTLEILIKAWQKTRGDQALALVRKQKISWGTVLLAGSPTEIKKGKKKQPDQRVIVSPSKPSTSPWLSVQERVKISKLLSVKWSFTDELRKQWVALPPEEQHKQYNAFITKIKTGYEDLSRISSSVHAKLGHRKNWIYRSVSLAGLMPKSKKDREDNFKISTIFFASVKLSDLHPAIKKTFAPSEYAEAFAPECKDVLVKLVPPVGGEPVTLERSDFALEDEGESFELWQIWAEKFIPVLAPANVPTVEAKSLDDDNIFSVLQPDSSGSREPETGKPPVKGKKPEIILKKASFADAAA